MNIVSGFGILLKFFYIEKNIVLVIWEWIRWYRLVKMKKIYV